jgi:hypothetical protein
MALIRLNNQSISPVTALPNLASLPSGIDTGKLLQYKFTTNSTQLTKSGTSGTVDIFNDLSITPVSSTSKFIIQFHCHCTETGSNTANSIRFELHKNGSSVFTFSDNELYRSANEERSNFSSVYNGIYDQSSAFTLNVAFRNGNYSENAKVSVNNNLSTLSVYEIAS